MNSEIKVSAAQINKMKHAIGFDRSKAKRGKYEAYRNYYSTCDDDAQWEELVGMGLAGKRTTAITPDIIYYVSAAGMQFIGEMMGVTVTEMR